MTVAEENDTLEQEPESEDVRILPNKSGERIDASKLDIREEVISLKRVAKVVKGGRRFSFSALVVVGDGHGHVGVGFGKANEVPDSIQKAVEDGKKKLIRVPIIGRTLPHEIIGEYGAGQVLLQPAAEGTGLICGPAVRAVLEMAGIRDAITKNLRSQNVLNVSKATFEGLRNLMTAETVSELRGKTMEEMLGNKGAERYREGREIFAASKAELTVSKKEERGRRGTYSAGGRRDEDDSKKNDSSDKKS